MFIRNWKNTILTIPNLLSILRIGLIPIYISIYRSANKPSDYWIAGSLIAISCLTDGLDGYIARRYHMYSFLGKILDPLADKLTQFALCFTLHFRYPALAPLLYLLLAKEIFQLIGLTILIKQGIDFPGSIHAGKISTTVLFVSLISIVLFPTIPDLILHFIIIIDAMVLIAAFFSYFFRYMNFIFRTQIFRI